MARSEPSRLRGANPRRVALEVVSQALAGRAFARDLLESRASRFLSDADRRLAVELTYGVIRRVATLDAVIAAVGSRPVDRLDGAVLQVLRLGTYQVIFMDRIPAHAAVSESVRLARSTGHAAASGFVNAVLRQVLRSGRRCPVPDGPAASRLPLDGGEWFVFDRPVLPDPSDQVAHLAAAYSYPEWLVARWAGRYGADTAVDLFKTGNRTPAISVRPNTLRTTGEDLAKALAAEGIQAAVNRSGLTLRLAQGANPAALSAFRRGDMTPQDDSAAAVASFLRPRPGETVLDLCAAPGGKTTHLAELMGNSGAIVAVDVTDDKLRRVRENVERLGIGIVTCALADGEAFAAQAGPRFDAVLVDAPCTNTGVLGRRVEARWRLNDAAMAELTTRQRGLLRAGMRAVRPGGRLVYSTCSLEPEENGGLVAACLSGSDFLLEDERLIMPWAEGDGAYMARLRRREAAS